MSTASIVLVETLNATSSWQITESSTWNKTLAPSFNQSQKPSQDLLYNGTGYYIEEEGETGLSDLQTLFLACFATLVPLILSVFTAFGIRILWTRYKKRKENIHYDGILHSERTSDSVVKPLHRHLLGDKADDDTHLSINTDDVIVCDGGHINSQIRDNNHSTTNGSIITMTLKNNHLIVETEERNDIEEDSRETTMKYSPSARDGVFVVEVQQGVRRSPGSGNAPSFVEPEVSGSISDQCALVHNPPERYSDEETLGDCDDSEYYIETTSPNRSTTGLSTDAKTGFAQSNTSLSSIRPSYSYTNQQCYDNGSYGYSVYSGYVNDEPVARLATSDVDKPKIMSAIYKTVNSKAPFVMNSMNESVRAVEKFPQKQQANIKADLPGNIQETSKCSQSQDMSAEKEKEDVETRTPEVEIKLS